MADSTRVQTEIQDNSRLPDLTKDAVKMKLVQKGYLYYTPMAIFGSIVVPAVLAFFISVVATDPSEFVSIILAIFNSLSFIILVVSALVLAFAFTIQYLTQPGNVYLVDFACHEPKANHRVTSEEFMRRSTLTGKFTPESIQFQTKILEKSGIGPTAFPAALVLKSPPELTMQGAREEFEDVVYPCIEALLSRNNLRARDIDILVVNCSLFCPTPSLSAMIVNKFKMRSNIVAYNLGGMGCSASVIAVDLAKRLLQGCPKSRAIVVSTENITQNWYLGNNRPMLVTNTLFREGGAAMLLSNHPADKGHAMFKLLHTVRTHKGADDDNFKCVYQEEDENGITGVSLSKTVMKVAGDALKSNITTLGPLTLPLTEQIFFFLNLCARKIILRKLPKMIPHFICDFIYLWGSLLLRLPDDEETGILAILNRRLRSLCKLPLTIENVEAVDDDDKLAKLAGKPYIPNFTKAFEHFCVHAGGRGVLDAIEKNLQLPQEKLNASRHTLYNYGNTSSSSIWYEMKYHCERSNIRKGDRIWQIAFGSGFKCNSAVWESIRSIPAKLPEFTPHKQ